jgi:hypothetical protein
MASKVWVGGSAAAAGGLLLAGVGNAFALGVALVVAVVIAMIASGGHGEDSDGSFFGGSSD